MDTTAYYQAIDAAYQTLSGKALEHRLLELLQQSGAEFGLQHPFYAAMLNELGGYYRGQNLFEDSERYFLQALAVFRGLEGVETNLATTLNNLAGTHRLMQAFDRAKQEFSEALELYGASVGTDHILYASALNNLSLLCLDQQDYDGAEHYLSSASKILSKTPEYQEEYASALCNLANLHYFRKQSQLARAELEEAIHLHEHVIGTRTPHYHSALHTLGIVLLDSGLVKEAYDALQKASAAANALYGPDHDHTRSISRMASLIRQKLEAQA